MLHGPCKFFNPLEHVGALILRYMVNNDHLNLYHKYQPCGCVWAGNIAKFADTLTHYLSLRLGLFLSLYKYFILLIEICKSPILDNNILLEHASDCSTVIDASQSILKMNVIHLISHIKLEEKIPMDRENFTAMVSYNKSYDFDQSCKIGSKRDCVVCEIANRNLRFL